MFCNGSDLLFLIPAAGFGRRVGSPESKEMQFRSDKKRHIDFALDLAKEKHCACHVISRKEKLNLNEYLLEKSRDQEIQLQLVEPTRDWPETLMMSHGYWRKWNLVFLPDMEFSPLSTLDEMLAEMRDDKSAMDLLVAHHSVSDSKKWGYFLNQNHEIWIGEKPRITRSAQAWGLYAFRKEIGSQVLSAQLSATLSGEWEKVEGRIRMFSLNQFRDLARALT